jgi:hypothetical protein
MISSLHQDLWEEVCLVVMFVAALFAIGLAAWDCAEAAPCMENSCETVNLIQFQKRERNAAAENARVGESTNNCSR